MFATDDTIVAIATPPGRGGLGVVRVSGPRALEIAQSLISRQAPLEPRVATHTYIREKTTSGVVFLETPVDEVVATYFANPHSYTGEDVIEISGHGSPVLLERIVQLALAAGARLAEPGEFTLRAYLNGRMDLVQAEAVADLIDAVTPQQARAAMDQLDGTVTGAIKKIDAALFSLIARCEASLDFPDEGFHFIQQAEVRSTLSSIADDLRALIATASRGRLLREGRTVVIVGRPNTGKSSLFNALLGRNRAIVTPIPGTTRDVLSEQIDVLGVPVTLIDTAGLRESHDPIEREGVARAGEARAAAAMTLLVLDGSSELTADDDFLLNEPTKGRRVIAISKADLPPGMVPQFVAPEGITVSATTGFGLDELREAIVREVSSQDDRRDTPMLTNIRHIALAQSALDAAARALAALDRGATEELLLVDLHDARHSLEDITGTRTIDDVLLHIFTRFCVGK
ncbi:MAG: tRNA uridine-5-carboxymethylaminomethyl(34) synthesis GTPase MnmE [Acidobacteria bacterium]|nr:MAG: tRNA uridine-5-carboxymethylaminomethyl(34) synthesis GTPase MnmE [Acidobacteriota bacterium]